MRARSSSATTRRSPWATTSAGPNHVLPTGRNGRVRGGLSVLDFVKIITVQQYTRDALREVGPHTIALAEAEGLKGHAESVRVRMR